MVHKARYTDDLFFIAVIVLFLLINYNMPLATIYQNIIYLVLFMYLAPLMFNWFRWIPLSNKANRINEIIAGVAASIGFIWIYNHYLTGASTMATVFATTAFGESVALGKFTYGLPIPIIESVFFFVILPTWVLWKMGKSFAKGDLFNLDNVIMAIVFAAVFTIFHATSKGLTNNLDLAATFFFGVISIGLILFFGAVLPALILHIVVNSHAINMFEALNIGMLSSPYIIGGIIVVVYLFTRKDGFKIPFIGT